MRENNLSNCNIDAEWLHTSSFGIIEAFVHKIDHIKNNTFHNDKSNKT